MTRSLLLLLLLALPAIAHAQPAGPPDATYFRYTNRRTVHDGRLSYAGYSDALVASGRYDVTTPSPGRASIHADYRWRYDGGDRHEQGAENRTVEISIEDRRYTTLQTDLDEYDHTLAPVLATWVWIPRDVAVGVVVPILDRDFTVASTNEAIEIAGAPRTAIQLRAFGNGRREDDYGSFATTYTDTYWFDAATGMFLQELYEEHDEGSFEGEAAAFDVTERVAVFDASYAPAVGPLPPDPLAEPPPPAAVVQVRSTQYHVPLFVLALTALGGLFVYFLLRRASHRDATPLHEGKEIQTELVTREAPIPAVPPDASVHFGPFLPHFVELARRTSNAVVVAKAGGAVCGIGFGDADSKVASIFASSADVCELIREKLGTQDFFSEMRHGNLPSVVRATEATGSSLSAAHAYNVLETYAVLRRSPLDEKTSFDANVVGRLTEKDAAEAAALLDGVLGVPCRAFLDASLALGDVGYVARVDGRIVGVGLASLAGTTGRLHTLAVHPDHRAKGLGKELVRARLRALAELGATSVVTEIATWNLASLEIARANGLENVSEMFVESARAEKVQMRVVRR